MFNAHVRISPQAFLMLWHLSVLSLTASRKAAFHADNSASAYQPIFNLRLNLPQPFAKPQARFKLAY